MTLFGDGPPAPPRPAGRSVVIEADGGSRGNPGPAGFGASVTDAATGATIAERSESIGTATNNVAEYGGLIAGLEAAAASGATHVAVRMDSKLVVEQMSGRWQIKHPDLRPLARRANELRRTFETVTFQWIPREKNKVADRLANEAMDRAAGVTRQPKKSAASASPRASAADLAARVDAVTRLTGEFTLRSGQTTDEYFDKYRFEADPALLGEIAAALQRLVPSGTQVLAGLELGGIPLVTALSLRTGLPARFVRKKAKEYGTRQAIEGGEVRGRRVTLVEDVLTTGGAVLVGAAQMREAGADVGDVLCVVDREQGAAEAFAENGLRLHALLTRSDLDRAARG